MGTGSRRLPPDPWGGERPAPLFQARVITNLTAREIFRRAPAVKKYLRGDEFWSDGFDVNMVSRHGSEGEIRRYNVFQGR